MVQFTYASKKNSIFLRQFYYAMLQNGWYTKTCQRVQQDAEVEAFLQPQSTNALVVYYSLTGGSYEF